MKRTLTPTGENPWLRIPAADYEAHMEAVGQSAALRQLFSSVYRSIKPARLAILGCTTGADFEGVDPAVTAVAAGVSLRAVQTIGGCTDAATQTAAAASATAGHSDQKARLTR